MKKPILAILLSFFILAPVLAQDNEKTSAIHISFIPPLSTHGNLAGQYTNNVSINLLAGVSRNEKYFTFGGLGNIIHNNASGFQFAGLFNYIGNEANGLQFAGLYNYVGNKANGFQFGGLGNNTGDDFSGFQFAGLVNTVKDLNGFQFAGLVNVAKNVRGVQFAALVNIAENNDYPIGLINIIKNGEMAAGLSYDDRGSIMASFRSGGRVLYGIIGVGYNHRAHDSHFVTEGGFGAHIPVVNRFRINAEIKGQFMSGSDDDSFINKNSFAILPAFRIAPQLEIFAGPSINYMQSNDVKDKNLFPGNSLWKKHTDKKLKQIFIGYTAGIQWIF